jgi:hypothetical protein
MNDFEFSYSYFDSAHLFILNVTQRIYIILVPS